MQNLIAHAAYWAANTGKSDLAALLAYVGSLLFR